MNRFTKAVKSLAAKYNETSLILRIAIGLLIGAALAMICVSIAVVNRGQRQEEAKINGSAH